MTTTTSPGLVLVHVTGRDATTFLHGQFCADLETQADGATVLTAWCTAKGRVVTTLLALREGSSWYLLLPGSLADAVLRRLQLYVLRAEVTLTPMPAESLSDLQRQGHLPTLESLHDTARGLPWVEAATSELFLPQELDLERRGGLSYTKGCYPGQEIIARLRYRGEVKRGLARLQGPGSTASAALPGTRLEDGAGKTAGTVLYGASTGDDAVSIMAVVDNGVPAPGVLYLASSRTPVDVLGRFS